MTGETNLPILTRSMQPVLRPVSLSLPPLPLGKLPDDILSPVMVFQEEEGTTLVVDQAAVQAAGLGVRSRAQVVRVDLEDGGLSRPNIAGRLEGRPPSQCLEVFGEVVVVSLRAATAVLASHVEENGMSEDSSRHTRVGNHALHPETMMLGFGYDPGLSEGAVKPPIFLTSTFVFRSAEEGRDYFDVVAGRKPAPAGGAGLVYSRFNHPNAEIIEDRLAIYEGAERALVFGSGMAAIATTILAHSKPGDAIVHSQPLYGGTETLLTRTLASWDIHAEGFTNGLDADSINAAADRAVGHGRISVIFIETPSNPMNSLVDFQLVCATRDRIEAAQGHRPLIVCDNTMLGPIFQAPLRHGVDVVVYSLTKYVGGHSDLVAGAALGSHDAMRPVQALRSAIGTQLDPHTCWMIGRSLETLSLRMHAAGRNAERVADFLAQHALVERVFFLGPDGPDAAANAVYARQCSGAGSTFSVTIRGGQAEAFRVLNSLQIFKLAVSLGGTESLVSHPASTTHSGVPSDVRLASGVTDSLIRISIGIEHADDLIADLAQALAVLEEPAELAERKPQQVHLGAG